MLDLLRLRSFVDAVNLGSFAAAAARAGYTAPAVSQHVGALERELGCQLVIRGRRGVTATPPGALLLTRAEELLRSAAAAESAVRAMVSGIRHLRIGAFPSAAQHLLPPALLEIRRRHPDIELSLLSFEPPEGLAELAAGDIDVLITHQYPGVPAAHLPRGVTLAQLPVDPMVLITPGASRESPQARGVVDVASLRELTLISGAKGDANRRALEAVCDTAGFVPTVAFETNDYAVTAALVSAGFGAALVPQMALTGAQGIRSRNVQQEDVALHRKVALASRGDQADILAIIGQAARDT